jgi:hypothetical protein
VNRVAAVVLEDQPDHGQAAQARSDDEKPPAEHNAGEGHRGGKADGQRPPAVRAVETQLPRTFGDLGVLAVFWAAVDAAGREQQVEADQEGEAGREAQRGRASGLAG